MTAFDLLALVAKFAQQNNLALNDAALVDKFFADAAPCLNTALADLNRWGGNHPIYSIAACPRRRSRRLGRSGCSCF